MLDLTNPRAWSVLVVDDEMDNAVIVAETLTYLGLTVRTAENGAQGLEILESFMPDLVLLDLSMPKMDGWEMRRRIKANILTTHLPVIAVSAHAMAGDKERALDAGFDGYLTKPIGIFTLLDDLCAALQEAKAYQDNKTPERTQT